MLAARRWIRNRYRIRERRSVFRVDCFLLERRFHARSKRDGYPVAGISRNQLGLTTTTTALGNFRAGDNVPLGYDRSIFFVVVESLTERATGGVGNTEGSKGWGSSRGNFELETEALARLHAPTCHVIMRELSYRVRDLDSASPLEGRKREDAVKHGANEVDR